MTDLLNVIAVGILLGGIYALVSVGLNLIFGVIRIVNFAQGEFVMLGMYGAFAAYSVLHIDPYLASWSWSSGAVRHRRRGAAPDPGAAARPSRRCRSSPRSAC